MLAGVLVVELVGEMVEMLAALMGEPTAAKMAANSDERSAEWLVSKMDGMSAAKKDWKKETRKAVKLENVWALLLVFEWVHVLEFL
jgi:hypothetical protein